MTRIARRLRLETIVQAASAAIAIYILIKTTVIPGFYVGFFGDDFYFLNWASHLTPTSWVDGFFRPNHHVTLTYRPMALVVYLLYLTENPRLCYFILACLYAVNAVMISSVCTVLTNRALSSLVVLLFLSSFIYYDANHKIYNLISQVGLLLFLLSLRFVLIAAQRPSGRRRWRLAAYVLYLLSILTYEATIGGFVLIAAGLFHVSYFSRDSSDVSRPVHGIRAALVYAVRNSIGFLVVSVAYVLVNALNPIKSFHLTQHATPLRWDSIPLALARSYRILKQTAAWIFTVERRDTIWGQLSLESVLLSLGLVSVIAFLIKYAARDALKHGGKSRLSKTLVSLVFVGLVWFSLILVPAVLATYFDYRLTFFPYAGLALAGGALLVLVYMLSLRLSNRDGGDIRGAAGFSAVALSVLATLWIISNLSVVEGMNQRLMSAHTKQEEIVRSLGRYIAYIPNGSMIAITHEERPAPGIPDPYLGMPFSADYELEGAIEYYFGRVVNRASMFFQPAEREFTVGRFRFAREAGPYDRLVLFKYAGGMLSLLTKIEVDGATIVLPLTSRLQAAAEAVRDLSAGEGSLEKRGR